MLNRKHSTFILDRYLKGCIQWFNCYRWYKLCNGFDTTYTLKGKQFDYDKGRDLVVSGITNDFIKSPTSAYVKVKDTSSNATGTQTENPFATKEQVSEKIKSVLNGAIDTIFSGAGLTFTIGPATYVIKCTFGDSLDDFECSPQGGFKF